MSDLNTIPEVGAIGRDDEKAAVEPGLDSDSPRLCSIGSSLDIDPRLERIVGWKRDLLLIPLLGVLYTIMFLDRTNIANARIEGLEKGLDMPSHGYNNCLWIFYIPFIIAGDSQQSVPGVREIQATMVPGQPNAHHWCVSSSLSLPSMTKKPRHSHNMRRPNALLHWDTCSPLPPRNFRSVTPLWCRIHPLVLLH